MNRLKIIKFLNDGNEFPKLIKIKLGNSNQWYIRENCDQEIEQKSECVTDSKLKDEIDDEVLHWLAGGSKDIEPELTLEQVKFAITVSGISNEEILNQYNEKMIQ